MAKQISAAWRAVIGEDHEKQNQNKQSIITKYGDPHGVLADVPVSLITLGFVLSANANERKTTIITFDAPGAVNGTSPTSINPGGLSQDSILTQTLFLTASCGPTTAPSRRSIFQSAVPWLMFHRSQAQPSARTGRLREATSTPAWWDTVSCALPTGVHDVQRSGRQFHLCHQHQSGRGDHGVLRRVPRFPAGCRRRDNDVRRPGRHLHHCLLGQ